MYDIIIKNGTIYSGEKKPPGQGDIAIKGDKIAKIATEIDSKLGKKIIDATGLTITPGFIDPHASTGFGYFFPNAANHKLYQGITTEIFGNCGTSPAPIGRRLEDTMQQLSEEIGFPFDWNSLADYFDRIEGNLQFNIATLVGHSTLRAGYLSDWHRVSTEDQRAMEVAALEAMDEGALGFSTGLIYSPGCFAETEEIVALAKTVASKGGIYASHIRSEREEIEAAVDEALSIGEQANCRVLISHLKAAEQPNWGKIPSIIKKIEAYNQSHEQQAWVDVYPYTAVSTKLRAFIPKAFLADGMAALPQKLAEANAEEEIQNWIEMRGYQLEEMLVISNNNKDYINKTVAELAAAQQVSLARAIITILLSDTDTWVVYHCISEADMDAAILWPNAMICTDSWSYPINAPTVIGSPHPRSYGAFTSYLERYVIENDYLSVEEAIYKITKLPAEVFQLDKRGQIAEGYYADIVAFDWGNIKANATYLEPKRLSEGVEHLWVNGQAVIEAQKIQDIKSGTILNLNYAST